MDRIPIEIHSLIFSYACTDDGTTGRALSYVSRHIRHTSAPFRFISLSVSGIKQARGFLAQLQHLQPSARPSYPIYHLFLSTRPPSLAADDYPVQFAPPTEWVTCQAAILRYAAPTLCTLTFASFDLNDTVCVAEVLAVSLPRLVELTIRARCSPAQLHLPVVPRPPSQSNPDLDASLQRTAEHVHPRPSLRRVHLACAFHGFATGTSNLHSLLRIIAPSSGLTHLRLSILDMWGARRVAEVLHAELAARGIVSSVLELTPLPRDVPVLWVAKEVTWKPVLPGADLDQHSNGAAAEDAQDRADRSYDSLERFVLQPPPTALTDFFCSCCMELRGDVDVMRVFEALACDASERGGARFGYMRPKRGGYGYAEALRDWRERIADKGGCW
ncbi:hypothetical protein OBBRIDRAFT_705243, partial [Obba rivulosa]